MSYVLMAWANDQTTGSPTRKAVLLALADRANGDTGKCCPSVELIAKQTEFSIRTVQTALVDLCELGLVSRQRRKRGDGWLGGYDYTFADAAPAHRPATPAQDRPATAADEREPGTSLEPVEQGAHAGRALGKVDRQVVKPEHEQLARDVLAEWNRQTSQDLTSKDWLAKIVMRIREHPDYGIEEHAHVITAALASPWWTGPPTPSVVYGNGAQFERSIVAAQKGPGMPARRYGLGMSSEEILRRTQDPE